MDIFAQNKLLIKLVVVLVILNLMSIGFFFWKELGSEPAHVNDGQNENSMMPKLLQHELNLNESQVNDLIKLRSDFYAKEKQLSREIRAERDSMNTEMFNPSGNDELVMALAKRVSENEYKMELLRFEQAKKFKSLCQPDQLKRFNELVKEIRDYFKPPKEPQRQAIDQK
ncbi:MAG: Spy/CpxP family protein refolding chaperone [Bacteroidota bacterium]